MTNQQVVVGAREAGADPAVRIKRISSAILALVGVVGATWSVQLGLGSIAMPGAGLWPFIVSVGLTLATVVHLAVSKDGREDQISKDVIRVVIGAASVAIYALLFTHVHFLAAGVVLLVIWLKVLGSESWLATVLIAIITTAVCYVLFFELLEVPPPWPR